MVLSKVTESVVICDTDTENYCITCGYVCTMIRFCCYIFYLSVPLHVHSKMAVTSKEE